MKSFRALPIDSSSIRALYLPLLLAILALFFLLWNLNGDPSILKRYGDYGDEGYWVQNAINKLSHGKYLTDDQSVSYFGAPLYNQLLTLQFRLFGISFLSARVVSVLFLLLTAMVLFYILKPHVRNKRYLWIYVISFLLLFDNKLYYQWATPVPMEIFFQSLLLLILTRYKLNRRNTIIAVIMLLYGAILSKTTSIWLIGFLMMIFFFDYREEGKKVFSGKLIIKLLFFFIICIVPYLLLNLYFIKTEPERFLSFNQLLQHHVGFNFEIFFNFLNPHYYVQGLAAIFKYPNSFFLLLIPMSAVFFISFRQSYFRKFLLRENRTLLVLGIYLITFLLFLIMIGGFGLDRRLINFIFPLYILLILIFDRYHERELRPIERIGLCIFFLLIAFIQIKSLLYQLFLGYRISGLRQEIMGMGMGSAMVIVSIVAVFIVLSCLLIYRFRMKHLFSYFIVLNLLFHVGFLNTGNTLPEANQRIDALATSKGARMIVGYNAHQLAMEGHILPIWWFYKGSGHPPWNENMQIFTGQHPTLVVISTNPDVAFRFFPIDSIPEDYTVTERDTLFLYKNNITHGYNDTLVLHVVEKRGPEK